MKIFLAGATGVIGRRLVPQLVGSGHEVVALTRTQAKADALAAAGAEPVIADALDRDAVSTAVAKAAPEVVVHQLTALAGPMDIRKIDEAFAATNTLRTLGTDILLDAAVSAGARAFAAQSFAGWPYARAGALVKTEDDPLDPEPAPRMRSTLDAIRHLESTVTGAKGIAGVALRYGGFYGPGTSVAADGEIVQMVRRRRFPIVGGGAGIWSFIHVDDAATATRLAIERGATGVYNIVDDDPAPVREWLPALAAAAGAKPPMRLPGWVGRLALGPHGLAMMTEIRGASNAKAKLDLGWQPMHPSWRDGFRTLFT